jgi:hypothetical protein
MQTICFRAVTETALGGLPLYLPSGKIAAVPSHVRLSNYYNHYNHSGDHPVYYGDYDNSPQ